MSIEGGCTGLEYVRRRRIERPFVAVLASTTLVGFLAAVLLAPVGLTSEDLRKKREQAAFEAFLSDHPYNVDRSEYEREFVGKENPQERFLQEYLLMIDPHEKRVPSERLYKANRIAVAQRRAQRSLRKSQAAEWIERGPDNVGGRTRAIMFDPNDQTRHRVWAGGVAGGLWVTDDITDANTGWSNVDDFWANIAVSSITYDPTAPSTFYVGTGEGWFNYGSLRGAGIFKSTDGGLTWAQLASTTTKAFQQVQDIVVTASGAVLAATSRGKGVQRSTDGGLTWTTVLDASTASGRGADIEIGPDGSIYASVGVFAPGQIWKSTDDGVTWTQLNTGSNGFPIDNIQRIEIAAAPSDANRVYAAVSASDHTFDGLYRSFDGGATWESMPQPNDCDVNIPDTDFGRGQSWYDLILAVNPQNEDDLIAGAVDIFRTTSAGGAVSWSQMGAWTTQSGCAGVPLLHPDHHVVAYRPGSTKEVVFGNDGGIFYTSDVRQATVQFIQRNKSYNVTQYYSIAQGGSAGSNLLLGGTQDNGTPKMNQGGLGPELQDVTGGDGGYTHISQNGSQVAIASSQWIRWYRSMDGGNSFSYLGSLSSGGTFINPSDLDDDTNHLFFYYDENSIGRLNNLDSNPVTWDQFGPPGGFGSPVTHIRNSDYAPDATATVFVGTRNGAIFKVDHAEEGGSAHWTELNTTPLPVAAVSSIDLVGSESQMVVTFSNYGVASVWMTEDGGSTWTDLDTGRGLPDLPVWWAEVDPANPEEVFLATDAGLWRLSSISGGSTWTADPDIPTTRVVMLDYRDVDGTLVAATHGRGIWTRTLSNQVEPQLALSAMIEGANRGAGPMGTSPAFSSSIPTEQPYGAIADRQPSGGDTVELPADVVDWVLVSLRTGTNASTNVPGSEHAALLMADGSIVAPDGGLLKFAGVAPGSYYVVLEHRNHLAVMSSQPVDMSSGYGSWDFTAGLDKAYAEGGAIPMVTLADGRTAMFAADASADGQIAADDFNIFLLQTTADATGYVTADFNLDGQVTALDFNIFLTNSKRSAQTQVPE